MVNAGWLSSTQSEIFFQIIFIIFQGCPTKQAAFLPKQRTPYNQLGRIFNTPMLTLLPTTFLDYFSINLFF